MIESYAYLAMFALQILAMSVLHPALLLRYTRAKAADYPPDRFPQLYVGIWRNLSTERFCTLYLAVNTGIVVLGVLILGGLSIYLRGPNVDHRAAPVLTTVLYFLLQMSPLMLFAMLGFRHIKLIRSLSLESKRKAVLQRRGLFDFVSPFMVFVAVLGNIVFVAFMIYIIHFHEEPFPKPVGYLVLGGFLLSEVVSGLWVYWVLYGKKINPVESHAERVHTIGLTVRNTVYTSIATSVFLPVFFTLALLDLGRWMPFAQSAFLVFMSLCFCLPFIASPRRPAAGGLGTSPAR